MHSVLSFQMASKTLLSPCDLEGFVTMAATVTRSHLNHFLSLAIQGLPGAARGNPPNLKVFLKPLFELRLLTSRCAKQTQG